MTLFAALVARSARLDAFVSPGFVRALLFIAAFHRKWLRRASAAIVLRCSRKQRSSSQAAIVPPGVQLAAKQELVRNNAHRSRDARSERGESRAGQYRRARPV